MTSKTISRNSLQKEKEQIKSSWERYLNVPYLTLSWRTPLSHRNQSIDLLHKCLERVKESQT